MKILFIVNDAPYGTEKAYNAFRMAMSLQKEHADSTEILIFLLADAVTCALKDQKTPQGYYNIERMLKAIINKCGFVKSCGSCCDARGIEEFNLLAGVEKSTMSQLTQWIVEADKVLVF